MKFPMHAVPSTREGSTKYPPPCKIVNNIVIGEETSVHRECIGIGELLLGILTSDPDFIGQIDSMTEERRTFAEIKDSSVRCALWMRSKGIQPGDVVAVSTHNHLDSIAPLLGCFYIGALFYPMHFELNIQDARYFLSLARPKILFVNAASAEIMAQAAKDSNVMLELVIFGRAPGYKSFAEIVEDQDAVAVNEFRCTPITSLDQIGMIVCSSGSTGSCKGTMLSHSALINHMLCDDSFAQENENVVMWFSSFRWVSGALLPFQSIYLRKTWIITTEFDAELMCKLVEKYNVSWMLLQTSRAVCVLKHGFFYSYRFPSLRRLIIGGAAMKPLLHEAVIKALPHVEVLYTYGICEAGGVCTVQRQGDKLGSSGYVFKNEQLKVIAMDTEKSLGPYQVGELLWKSPYITNGYYNDSQQTRKILDQDGWIHSGDLGYYDHDGEIYICDRINELIKVKGVFVYPTEIESVLQGHPAVREVAVVRMHSDDNDEQAIAFVAKVPGKEVSAKELIKLVADNLEEHKHLYGGVQFLDELPHTDTGKIARKQLKEMAKRYEMDDIPQKYTS